MANTQQSAVDIAFDCLPLRCIGRMDVPIDASEEYRKRCLRIKAEIDQNGAEHSFYLYNARCVFRFANSEFIGSCRFRFEGLARTDAGGRKASGVDIDVQLTSETCDGAPPEVERWLAERVRQAVVIEFDRFLSTDRHMDRVRELGTEANLGDIASFAGIDV
jgi:hypothetical protein